MSTADARSSSTVEPAGEHRHRVILLPGGIAPGAIRYAALIEALGESVDVIVKDLELYRGESPPDGYSIETEVEGVSRAADEAGFDRFHLYGHSAGGGIALAYAATHPERLLSLGLDEPDSFFPEAKAEYQRIQQLPPDEQLGAIIAAQLAPGVELPPSSDEPEPEWMSNRPAGVAAFADAVQRYELPPEQLRRMTQPVYYSYGSLSNTSTEDLGTRLGTLFADFTMERYDGLHHFNTSHIAEPERVAASLKRLWQRAERVAEETKHA